jgi:cytochrome bd-type quinol oxidase subunit 2
MNAIALTPAVSGLSLVVTVVLIALLIQKEIISGSKDLRARRLNHGLTLVIAPLLVVFAVLVILNVAEFLR